jgi:hypothetical protein
MVAHPRRQYSSKIYIFLYYYEARQIPGIFTQWFTVKQKVQCVFHMGGGTSETRDKWIALTHQHRVMCAEHSAFLSAAVECCALLVDDCSCFVFPPHK